MLCADAALHACGASTAAYWSHPVWCKEWRHAPSFTERVHHMLLHHCQALVLYVA